MSASIFPYTLDLLRVQVESSGEVENKAVEDAGGLFDKTLTTLWKDAQAKGLFRYNLTTLPSRILHEKYRFVLQLNHDRAQKRRKPQEISSLKQAFNPDEFNFKKVNNNEIILRLNPIHGSNNSEHEEEEDLLLINVSPLEFGHVLLTPSRNKNNPQLVTIRGLRLAVELALLSSSGDFRVGFNSLCGYASVNHEHYHAYYLQNRLYLEYASLAQIYGPCYELEDYPGPGFVFLLYETDENSMRTLVSNVTRLTDYLRNEDTAHNLFITRGSSLSSKLPGKFDTLRVYVWARASSFGAKGCDAFNPALCELGGHFPCKTESAYETLTEEIIIKELGEICREFFVKTRKIIPTLFN